MPVNLIVFFVLAYGLSWAWWLPLALSGATVAAGDLPTHVPGLFGPAIAALVTAALVDRGRAVADLGRRTVRVRFPLRAWIATLAPVAFIGVGALVQRLAGGGWPDFGGLGRYSGIPAFGVAAVLAIVFATCLGEEIGWRGYALPRLQARFGPRLGTALLYPLWALWHLPNFWFLANFLDMDPFTLVVGWGLGLFAGTLVLAHVAHLARGSVLATSIWHFGYNAASATDLGSVVPIVATAFVAIWAVSLVRREWSLPEASALAVPFAPDGRPGARPEQRPRAGGRHAAV